jgi:hypothetical protein
VIVPFLSDEQGMVTLYKNYLKSMLEVRLVNDFPLHKFLFRGETIRREITV